MFQILKLKPGDKLIFKGFGDTENSYRRRLISLGLIPGIKGQLVKIAPLGCPLYFNFENINLALRKDEIKHLIWEKV